MAKLNKNSINKNIFFLFYKYNYFLACNLLLNFLNKCNASYNNSATFSDNLLTHLSPIFNGSYNINFLLNNTSVDRFEANKYCSSFEYKSIVYKIIYNSNYSHNAFESKTKHFPCEQLIELFCNPSIDQKYLISHSLMDCEDFLNINSAGNVPASSITDNKNSSAIKLVALSPTGAQIEACLTAIMRKFAINHYGIVYSDSITNTYYPKLASMLNYKFSIDSDYVLEFSVGLSDSSIGDLLANSFASISTKMVFLLLKCGEENIFMNKYSAQISTNKINIISIYDSPLCLPLINYYKSNLLITANSSFSNLKKLVAVDYNLNNYANYTDTLLKIILTNMTSEYRISNALDELESYYMLQHYNDSSVTEINEMGSVITLNCIANQAIATNETVKYCNRELNFWLYGYQGDSRFDYSLIDIIFLNSSINKTIKFNAYVSYNITSYKFETTVIDDNSQSMKNEIFKDVLFAVIAMIVLTVFIFILAFIIRSRLIKKELSKGPNKILLLPEDLEFVNTSSSLVLSAPNMNDPNKSKVSIMSDTPNLKTSKTAKYKGEIVIVKFLKIPNFQVKGSTMRELRTFRDLRHENLASFLGCYIDIKTPALIFEYANKGSLQDIILKKDIKLDWNFKWSMLNDLCRGMRYLHHSPMKYHGNLKSRNCIVDSRWVLKITDFGLPSFYANQNFSRVLNLSDLLWTAPEHLRQTTIRDQVVMSIGSQAGDVYGFSIIMQELIVRGTPFCMMGLSDEEIINKIRKPPPLLRPSVSKTAAPPEYVNIMRDCWNEQPELRPSFDQLYSMFKSLNGEKKVNIVDLMFKMIEQYTNNLEDLIKEKTLKLEDEKKLTEKLLSEMLPKTVAESLMSGLAVPPESFDCVTIYFSDIVGFTTISAYSAPIEVVQLLNDLYTMFDKILTDFDVYKVETIGDAYMVVSGLPLRNGILHAGEIATMALNLLHHCGKFQIKHLPGVPLRLRIGMHSGACVTGVVGLKMPRYCLFGDTVNTASRMESTSQAYRIHVSESTAKLLDEIGGYYLEFRGMTELKGKGMQKTFWLTGKENFDLDLPDPVQSENNHGIDSKLIETIEKIKAENLAKSKEEERITALTTNMLKSSPSGDNKMMFSPSEHSITNAEGKENELAPARISRMPSKIGKFTSKQNDSGFSESIITVTSPPSDKNSALDTKKLINEKTRRLTDVESIA